MSDAETRTRPEDQDAELLAKLDRYSHLIPPLPPGAIARMLGEAIPPAQAASEAKPGAVQLARMEGLTAAQAADRALGCLLGLALGEGAAASGPGRPMTAAALCLADTLLSWDGFDEEDFVMRLQGLPAPEREGLDVDTKVVLDLYASGGDREDVPDPDPSGCGALARLAPVAVFARDDPDMLEVLAGRQCRLTHPSLETIDACCLAAAMLGDALSGADADTATGPRVMGLCPRVLFVSAGEWRAKQRDELTPGRDAVGTLETALWCVRNSDGVREAVTLAASFGGSGREAAVLAGQLAGALYGASSIPEDWLATLEARGTLTRMAEALQRQDQASRGGQGSGERTSS